MTQHNRYLSLSRLGVYTFRLRVPQELVPVLGKKEIYKSLGTRDLRRAEELCKLYELDVRRTLLQLRRKHLVLNDDEVDFLMKTSRESTKSKIQVDRIHAAADGSLIVEGIKYDPSKNYAEEHEALDGMIGTVRKHAVMPIQPPAQTPKHASVVATPVMQHEFVDTDQSETISKDVGQSSRKKRALFDTLCEWFCGFMESSKKWNRGSNRRFHQATFDFFQQFYGNRLVHTYTRENAEDFLERLQKMPARWNMYKEIKGLSYKEAIEKGYPTLEARSVSIYLKHITSFFKYAAKADFCDKNIFDGITIEFEEKNGIPYTKPEIQILFKEDNYTRFQRLDAPSRYWAPLIAAWTGMRLAEIFQLTTADIYKYHGIWIFDLNENPAIGKTIKNKSSVRIVPIHKRLKDLGLLDFLAERKKDRTTNCLFPEYPPKGEDSGKSWSMTFSRYIHSLRDSLGNNPDNLFPDGKVMHAFRHLFIKETRQRKIDGEVRRRIVGHSIDNDINVKYGGDPMKTDEEIKEILYTLNKAVQQLKISEYFPELLTYYQVKAKIKNINK